jgi:hypothetical protein
VRISSGKCAGIMDGMACSTTEPLKELWPLYHRGGLLSSK